LHISKQLIYNEAINKSQASETERTRKAQMQTVIALSGKAKQVFKFLALMAQYKGEKTLKDLR
jgi:hypothetical protein